MAKTSLGKLKAADGMGLAEFVKLPR